MPGKRIILIFTMVFLLFSGSALAAVPGPTDQLRVVVDEIIKILRSGNLSQDDILQQVAGLVRQKFDFQAMSQRTLGVNWRKATPKQQERFVELFSQLLEDTYRGRIRAYTYNDEKVEYVGERVVGTRAEVDTVVIASREIPVSYKMRLKDDQWLVYDVSIEQVSLVSNYRNSYGEIVRKEGFEGLLSRMEEKIRQLQAAPEQTNGGAADEANVWGTNGELP